MKTDEPKKIGTALPFLVLCAALALGGCPANDYGIDDCSAGDAPLVPDFWAGPGTRDVTFLAFGDSQVFLDASLGAHYLQRVRVKGDGNAGAFILVSY